MLAGSSFKAAHRAAQRKVGSTGEGSTTTQISSRIVQEEEMGQSHYLDYG